jgi:hypothetical protein
MTAIPASPTGWANPPQASTEAREGTATAPKRLPGAPTYIARYRPKAIDTGRGTALVSAGDPRPSLIVYLPIPPNQGSTCSALARIRSRTIIRTAALKMRRTRGEVSDAPACMPQTLQHFMMKVILEPGRRNEERALDPTSRILKRGARARAQRRYRPKSQQFAETFGSGCPLILLQPTRTAAASCDATVRASARCPSCKN